MYTSCHAHVHVLLFSIHARRYFASCLFLSAFLSSFVCLVGNAANGQCSFVLFLVAAIHHHHHTTIPPERVTHTEREREKGVRHECMGARMGVFVVSADSHPLLTCTVLVCRVGLRHLQLSILLRRLAPTCRLNHAVPSPRRVAPPCPPRLMPPWSPSAAVGCPRRRRLVWASSPA